MRIAWGQTVDDVATATGVPAEHIRQIEKGVRETDEAILRALASHYGVGIATLTSR